MKTILYESSEDNHYEILIILIDDLIHDIDETFHLLIDCESLPSNVIIVGICKENFSLYDFSMILA